MRAATILFAVGLASCNGCRQDASKADAGLVGDAAVLAEVLPRCREDAAHVAIPGEDVLVGDVAASASGLLVGVVRRDGQRRVASVVRAPLDLSSVRVVDVGPARGDEPPPVPRWSGTTAFVGFHAKVPDAGWTRELRVARVDEAKLGETLGSVVEQHDESLAFDLAWPEGGGAALVAWDEDAPPPKVQDGAGAGKGIERGFVKVRTLGDGKTRVASPETSDAESPRLLSRPDGFWLAWLARRTEETHGSFVEGPGEKRAFRWVEVVALDARGEPASPVRRVSPEKGRAVSFELARGEGGQLVVFVQDEAASGEGAGGRIVRHVVGGDRVETSDVVDGGVGHAIAELARGTGTSWLAWNDGNDRVHLVPLGEKLAPTSASTQEASLEGARVIGAASPDQVFAIVHKPPITELRRFVCARR